MVINLNLAFAVDYRFMNLLGGNLKLCSSVGLPIYQDLNSKDIVNRMGMPFQQVQPGGDFFVNVAIQYTIRNLPDIFNPSISILRRLHQPAGPGRT